MGPLLGSYRIRRIKERTCSEGDSAARKRQRLCQGTIRGEPVVLQGQHNQCRCGLMVSNRGTVIAKHLYPKFHFFGARIIKVEDELGITPSPPDIIRAPDLSYYGLYMNFGEDVVCHPGQQDMYLAKLKLTFERGTMPRELLLSYILHAEKMQTMKDSIALTIDWQ